MKLLKLLCLLVSCIIIFCSCTNSNFSNLPEESNTETSGNTVLDSEEIASDELDNIVQDKNEDVSDETVLNSPTEDPKVPSDNIKKIPTAKLEEILPIHGPKPLHMEKRDPMDWHEIQQKHGAPTIAPIYGEGWRIQVVKIEGNNAVFEFGNLSNSDIVIDNNALRYILYNNGATNISGTHVVNGPVIIAPNEVKTVTLKASHTMAKRIFLTINGQKTYLDNRDEGENFSDITPYTAPIDDYSRRNMLMPEIIEVRASHLVSGDGKFKFLAEGVHLTDNKTIGPLKRPDRPDGMLVLVKIKIANTSDEDMTIYEIRRTIAQTTGMDSKDLPLEAVEALGDLALPLTIRAGEIVEGYVPFAFIGSQYIHSLVFETTLGPFVLGDIEQYKVLNELVE